MAQIQDTEFNFEEIAQKVPHRIIRGLSEMSTLNLIILMSSLIGTVVVLFVIFLILYCTFPNFKMKVNIY
jgi:hypothetical protein